MTHSTWPDWLPLRNDLRNLSPYGAPQLPAMARMNTNENPYPPSEELVAAIADRVKNVAGSLNRYPDRDAIALRSGLADYLNNRSGTHLNSENVWAANGSNEIIQTIFLAFGEGVALGFVPSYSMHALISQATRATWIEGNRNADFSLNVAAAGAQIKETKPRLVFVTTPNNPTGTAVSLSEIEELAIASREVGALLIVDEAYAEFSDRDSAVTLLSHLPNIVIIRTMSKAFAFAGARVGYAAANADVIRSLQLVRLPYHLSQITQAVALVALEYQEELLRNVSRLVEDRKQLATAIEEIGCRVVPSEANFLLFTVPSSSKVWDSLLAQGVLIRDVGLSGYLRVTIGTPDENQKFIDALTVALEGET